MPGDVTGWLNIVDAMDVWMLAILCAMCFWRIVRVLDTISTRLALTEQSCREMKEQIVKHSEHDHAEHLRIYDKLEIVRQERQS